MYDTAWKQFITLEGIPEQQAGSPEGASGEAGGTEETDYFGLGAPIDGQMNQQGPLSFIHSPNGPSHRSGT